MSILQRHSHRGERHPSTPNPNYQPPVAEGSGSGGGHLPPEHEQSGENPWWRKTPAKIGATALATAAVVVGAMQLLDKDGPKDPPRTETTTSAPASTAPTAEAPSAGPTPSITETVKTPGVSEAMLLAEMETQSPEAFANRDIHEQLMYVHSKYDLQANKGVVYYWLSQKLPFAGTTEVLNGEIVYNNNPALKTNKLDEFADGQEIAAESAFRTALPKAWKVNPEVQPPQAELEKGEIPLDQSTAKKLASGAYFPGGPAWVSFINTLSNSPYAGGLKQSEVDDKVTNYTEYKDVGVEYKGENLKGRVLTVESNGKTYFETQVYVADPSGEGGDWLIYKVDDPTTKKKAAQ